MHVFLQRCPQAPWGQHLQVLGTLRRSQGELRKVGAGEAGGKKDRVQGWGLARLAPALSALLSPEHISLFSSSLLSQKLHLQTLQWAVNISQNP